MMKKRYAQVGLGGRSMMFSKALAEEFAAQAELVGLCDSNEGRLRLRMDWAKARGLGPQGYLAPDFDRMIEQCEPDCVIVTTVDRYHDEYICRAMELGCDVITEKPMTIDDHRCQRIIDTQRSTGRNCAVTFNYRYMPAMTQVKDLLMSGVIGDIISIDYHYLLNTNHGASYYNRWHAYLGNSGGLLVHKATHHFDLAHWWLSAAPASVYAIAGRQFYTARTADRYGLAGRAARCRECPVSAKCPFFCDITQERNKALYLDNEQYDGYVRDRCVFNDEIDIYDTMNLVVAYDSGVKMTYSLNSFLPWEGLTINFNGARGRLEFAEGEWFDVRRGLAAADQSAGILGEVMAREPRIRICPHFKEPYPVKVDEGKGSHGGGDAVMLNDLFHPNPPADKYLRKADQRSGAYSVLTGVAANKSIATGKPVAIADLVKGIGYPDYPPMPSGDEPLTYG
jgi:predicted dehydrogenase